MDNILNQIPTEIFLNVGEIVGSVDFKDLSGVAWNVDMQDNHDIPYVYARLYDEEKRRNNSLQHTNDAQRELLLYLKAYYGWQIAGSYQ